MDIQFNQQPLLTKKPGPKSDVRPDHLSYLDGLRALAAIYVVLFHALTQIEPDGKTFTGKTKLFASFFTFGHQAVDLFIVLSGFCLMLPVIKNDGHLSGSAYKFFAKRTRRILPPYFIALAFTLVCIQTLIGRKTGTGWDAAIPVTPKGLIAHLLLFQDVFRDTADQINGAFWSISVEWRIYFVFPLLVIAWRKIGPIASLMATLVTSYALLYLLSHSALDYNPDAPVGIMPQYLSLFALGMFGASIAHSLENVFLKIRKRTPWMTLMYGSMALLLVLCKMKIVHGSRVPMAYSDLAAGIWAASLLIAVSVCEKSRLRQFLEWKPVSFIGTYAYSIYLIHVLSNRLSGSIC